MLVFGGVGEKGAGFNDFYLYDRALNSWSLVDVADAPPTARWALLNIYA